MHVLQPMVKASYMTVTKATVIKMLLELPWAARVTNQFATRGDVEGGGGRKVAARGFAYVAMHPQFLRVRHGVNDNDLKSSVVKYQYHFA